MLLWVNFDSQWDCHRLYFLALVCVMVNLMHRLGWAGRYTDVLGKHSGCFGDRVFR